MIDNNIIILLKQYNLETDKMSNPIGEDLEDKDYKSSLNKELLINLGSDSKNHNRVIVEELLKSKTPIKEDLLVQISDFIDEIDDLKDIELDVKVKTALLLKKLKLPLNSNFLSLFKDSIDPEDALTELLKVVLSQKGQQSSEYKDFNLPTQQQELSFNLLLHAIKTLNIVEDIGDKSLEYHLNKDDIEILAKEISREIEDFLSDKEIKDLSTNSSTIDVEISKLILPKLKEIFTKGEQIIMPLTVKDKPNSFSLKLILKELLKEVEKVDMNPKKELLKNIINPKNLDPTKISKSIKEFNIDNIKESKLLRSLFNLSIKSGTKGDSESNSSDKLLKQLMGIRANNIQSDSINLFLPFILDKEPMLIRLNLNKENIREWEEGEELKVSFNISTDKLGHIGADIKIKEKTFELLFRSPKQDTIALIKDHIAFLKESLEEDGIRVAKVAYEVIKEPIRANKELSRKIGSIDIRV